MSPLTHALVTAAHLLDELGDPEPFASVQGYTDGRVSVQVHTPGDHGIGKLEELANHFGVTPVFGREFVNYDGTHKRDVSFAIDRDGVHITFWTMEPVT
jgi:hypothetical protein